jgi:hypothetical protein
LRLRWWRWWWLLRHVRSTVVVDMVGAVEDSTGAGLRVMVDLLRRVGFRDR